MRASTALSASSLRSFSEASSLPPARMAAGRISRPPPLHTAQRPRPAAPRRRRCRRRLPRCGGPRLRPQGARQSLLRRRRMRRSRPALRCVATTRGRASARTTPTHRYESSSPGTRLSARNPSPSKCATRPPPAGRLRIPAKRSVAAPGTAASGRLIRWRSQSRPPRTEGQWWSPPGRMASPRPVHRTPSVFSAATTLRRPAHRRQRVASYSAI